MLELIDKKASIKAICDGCFKNRVVDIELKCRGMCDAIDTLQQQPTIEAEPVRRGRWLNMTKGIPLTENQLNSYSFAGCCSVCGKNSGTQYQAMRFNFCPNCGAKMNGGTEDAGAD